MSGARGSAGGRGGPCDGSDRRHGESDRSGNEPVRPGDERRVGVARLAFAVLGSPILWAIHFNLVYFLNTLFCSGGWGSGDVVVMLTAVPFGAASAASGIVAYRKWRELRAGRSLRTGLVEHGGRSSVLLVMGIAASVLFTLLIVLESFAPIYVPSCPEVRP